AHRMTRANRAGGKPWLKCRAHPLAELPGQRGRRLLSERVLSELDDLIVLVGVQEAAVAPRRNQMDGENSRQDRTTPIPGQGDLQSTEWRAHAPASEVLAILS